MQPITGDELIALIPQKPPFVMISTLVETDGTRCVTKFIVTADNVLCNNGTLSAPALIENIAQTAAVMSGYSSKLESKPTPMGFIGDVRNFECNRLPVTGEEIVTEVVIENRIFDVLVIKGIIKLNNVEIAHASMKVFTMNEEKINNSN